MLKQLRVFAATAALVCSPLVIAEQSVDQVIDRYLEARGGLERLSSINTARLTGSMSMGGGHGGIHFKPVFDEYPQSIGAVRIDPGDKETIWVGTGESWIRNSVGVGNGVYKSSDGGDS